MNVSKTKVFAALFAILTVFQAQGFIHLSPGCLETLQALFGAGVAFGLRDAVEKVGK